MKWYADSYTYLARLFPTLLTNVPTVVMIYYLTLDPKAQGVIEYILGIKIGGLALLTVIIYGVSHIQRAIGKGIAEVVFKGGMPSTYLMLYGNQKYSAEFKERYSRNVKRLFQINLLTEEQERLNGNEARLRLKEAGKQVILFMDKGKLIFQHNVWFGFMRNLMGGSVIAVSVSFANIVLAIGYIKEPVLMNLGILGVVSFGLVLLFSKPLLTQFGEAYADQLLQEFQSKALVFSSRG